MSIRENQRILEQAIASGRVKRVPSPAQAHPAAFLTPSVEPEAGHLQLSLMRSPLPGSSVTATDSARYFHRTSAIPQLRILPSPASAHTAGNAAGLSHTVYYTQTPGFTTLDNISDGQGVHGGPSYSRVKSSEIISGTVKQINDGTNVRTAGAAASAMDSVGNLLLKNISSPTPTSVTPSTTSTTFAVIPEMTTTITTKGNKVFLFFAASLFTTAAQSTAVIAIFRDGVQVSQAFQNTMTTNNILFRVSLSYVDSVAAGSHTYDCRWKCLLASEQISNNGTQRSFQAVELG